MDAVLQASSQHILATAIYVVAGGAILIALFARLIIARARARTRRELIAYVQQGTMTQLEAQRLLSAGAACGFSCSCAAPQKSPATANPEDAEPLFEPVPTRSARA